MIDALLNICNKIWLTGEWPTTWTQSLVITLPKKKKATYSSVRTIAQLALSVMLKILLNRLKPKAEKTIAEEQAGFRLRRSTNEQIFNLRILCERCLQHQQDLSKRKHSTEYGMQPSSIVQTVGALSKLKTRQEDCPRLQNQNNAILGDFNLPARVQLLDPYSRDTGYRNKMLPKTSGPFGDLITTVRNANWDGMGT